MPLGDSAENEICRNIVFCWVAPLSNVCTGGAVKALGQLQKFVGTAEYQNRSKCSLKPDQYPEFGIPIGERWLCWARVCLLLGNRTPNLLIAYYNPHFLNVVDRVKKVCIGLLSILYLDGLGCEIAKLVKLLGNRVPLNLLHKYLWRATWFQVNLVLR